MWEIIGYALAAFSAVGLLLCVVEHILVGTILLVVFCTPVRRLFTRPPDFLIGSPDNPYLRRWHLVRRNFLFNIYLHHIVRDDDDRALHDHPWRYVSFILSGGYWEVTESGHRWYGRGSVVRRRAVHKHRLEVGSNGAWTLFFSGHRTREWGFHCPQGWVPWRDFTASGRTGEVGRGCG